MIFRPMPMPSDKLQLRGQSPLQLKVTSITNASQFVWLYLQIYPILRVSQTFDPRIDSLQLTAYRYEL